ncbi:MAG: hypothetical protein L6V89_10125 [Oscillospiraceae bacterium]|nr:MAG: hypothetical protein L6V89_10125 [Oscillospiraceae bacterium]
MAETTSTNEASEKRGLQSAVIRLCRETEFTARKAAQSGTSPQHIPKGTSCPKQIKRKRIKKYEKNNHLAFNTCAVPFPAVLLRL